MREHEIEPVPGLPEKLPEGEGILWQGSPRWWSLTTRALHLRGLAIYFALMVAWSVASAATSGGTFGEAALASATSLGLAVLCLGVLVAIGRALSHAALYTITNRRIVLRVGVALPMTINIPFSAIESAAVKQHADGTEDIVLTLSPDHKVAWLALWPHARPWRVGRAEPMLRAVPVTSGAAQALARALAASASVAVAPRPEGIVAERPRMRGAVAV
ncbi:photosynthetic complex putative assembly protein PuhB [Sediminicoccus sp. KRV36]|uniref:photosynthetic complex putative assembly protein PuhB n=1 Tax=Sediminicoccus sp. KRV36 TaxID=3133721 RepID=UPI00200BCE72|nr:photosynthetic complex putative assembly protein PuhB [Sediminicoccus rosea]UPY35328.1 PH domain-containing protein [Sediminicoccus rosea]